MTRTTRSERTHLKQNPLVNRMTSRFCYSYLRRPAASDSLCCPVETQPITVTTLSTMSTIPCIINNSTGTSSQALLLSNCYLQQQTQRQQTVEQKVSTLLASSIIVNQQLERQLATEVDTRYQPYRPFVPEFIPSSVIDLEMRTRNVGVPVPTMTIANCKGVQFVTT